MTSFEWEVPFLVVVIVAAIVYIASREDARADGPPRSGPNDPPTSGPELIERLERTLGIAIVVDSVEASEPTDPADPTGPGTAGPTEVPHTIQATLMFGRYTAPVVATGPTESGAWAELARMAIAWRNSDYQHIQMWPGGA